MKISVCIGSSCHLKGSREIIEDLQRMIEANHLQDKVELCATFCMNDCQNGVSVRRDNAPFSLRPEETEAFFKEEILDKLCVLGGIPNGRIYSAEKVQL